MDSRSKILQALAQLTGDESPLPQVDQFQIEGSVVSKFEEVLISIGGEVLSAKTVGAVEEFIQHRFPNRNVVSPIAALNAEQPVETKAPHAYESVDVVVLEGHFGVAENGAVWITESCMGNRVLPFICQHLVVLIKMSSIVGTMHQAYERIGDAAYDLGVFIAGPSKTADIEQSLVLGAHGPKTMTVFLLEE